MPLWQGAPRSRAPRVPQAREPARSRGEEPSRQKQPSTAVCVNGTDLEDLLKHCCLQNETERRQRLSGRSTATWAAAAKRFEWPFYRFSWRSTWHGSTRLDPMIGAHNPILPDFRFSPPLFALRIVCTSTTCRLSRKGT